MTAITLTTADARVVSDIRDQWTAEAAVAILPGQVIQLNAAGKWILAKATTAPLSTGCYVALRSAGVGQGLTGMSRGYFGGLDTELAINAAVYLSDTDGGIDTAAGTVSVVIGRIVKAGIMHVNCPV